MIPFNALKQYPADVNKTSPNYNTRKSPNLLVIILHATAGSDAGSESWMMNPKAQASAHLHIRRDGTVVRLVQDSQRAWHAGVSNYKGITDVNSCSIGIEIGNLNDGKEKYPEAQYLAVAKIIKWYKKQGDIAVVSHAEIAPGRKTDPYKFDWAKFSEMI